MASDTETSVEKGKAYIRQTVVEPDIRVTRPGIGNVLEPVSNVHRRLRRDKPGEADSPHHDEVKLRGLLGNSIRQVCPERPACKLNIRSQTIQRDKGVFDLRREPYSMSPDWLFELDVDHLYPDSRLPAIPPLIRGGGISQYDPPGWH